MPTNKNAIALYVRVVESGSFSRAAARERIPVSTVSRMIAALEKSLGVRLLERSTRQLRTTEIGAAYFEMCHRGLAEFDAADALISNRKVDMTGRLRISVPPSMSDVVILPLVTAFQVVYPRVEVHCLATERLVDHIADGVDLSLRVGGLRDSSLVAGTVATHRSKLVAAPAYLRSIAALRHPDEVGPHVQVAFSRWEKPVRWTLRSEQDSAHIVPAPAFVLNEYGGVLHGLIAGRGISEVPSFICAAALREGSLVEVLPAWRFDILTLAAVYPSNRQLSPLIRAFKDFCVDYFEQAPLLA